MIQYVRRVIIVTNIGPAKLSKKLFQVDTIFCKKGNYKYVLYYRHSILIGVKKICLHITVGPSITMPLGGVHKLRLQEEGGRWSQKLTFCKLLYHRKCKRRGVGGQKNAKFCKRSL